MAKTDTSKTEVGRALLPVEWGDRQKCECPSYNHPRRLTRFYIAALGAVALLALTGQLVIQNFLARQTSDSTVINIAGRQRMLSQQLSKAALALQASEEPREQATHRAELRDALALWQRSHHGLQSGDAELGLPGNNSAEIAARFAELETSYGGLADAA